MTSSRTKQYIKMLLSCTAGFENNNDDDDAVNDIVLVAVAAAAAG